MKANNGSGNIESRDEWETPKWLFDKLHKQFKFELDCCASGNNTKCTDYHDNFLVFDNPMKKISWMNPPFSKALEMFKHFFKVVHKGVAIYRCDNFETKIWQEVIFPNASWVFIPNKRIAYEGMKGSGSRFPSALIGFNVPLIESLDGITLTPFGASNCMPNLKLHATSPNPNIHQNFPFALQSRVQSSHNHSQREVQGALMGDNHTGFPLSDNSIKMLPLTLQSEIGTSDNTLIKGNLKN